MGLVEYSDSEDSDNESQEQTSTTAAPSSKQAFRKVVDRSNPHKIRVNLSKPASATADKNQENERPTKKPRIGGGGLFSGINSFLPAPKRSGEAAGGDASKRLGLGRGLGRGVNLKTGATPAFSREPVPQAPDTGGETERGAGTLEESTTREALAQESELLEPEVKLVGKATVFRPLSVARNSQKKKKKMMTGTPSAPSQNSIIPTKKTPTETQQPPSKPKISLFSISQQEENPAERAIAENEEEAIITDDFEDSGNPEPFEESYSAAPAPQTLDTVASQMNLDETARRQLFGRRAKGGDMPINIVNFNTDQEYAHNEELRATGETVQHNPLRTIAPGKHSLRQLVSAASTQKEALEESWAAGRRNKKEAGNKYGW